MRRGRRSSPIHIKPRRDLLPDRPMEPSPRGIRPVATVGSGALLVRGALVRRRVQTLEVRQTLAEADSVCGVSPGVWRFLSAGAALRTELQAILARRCVLYRRNRPATNRAAPRDRNDLRNLTYFNFLISFSSDMLPGLASSVTPSRRFARQTLTINNTDGSSGVKKPPRPESRTAKGTGRSPSIAASEDGNLDQEAARRASAQARPLSERYPAAP